MSSSTPVTRYFATGVAAVVLAFGAYLTGKSNSSPATGAVNAAARGGALPPGQAPSGAQGQTPQGQMPPGMGTQATGAAASRAKAAALAKYPGTVERIMALPDGSYEVHVIGSGGETHVHVSRDFKVTGTGQGGPPGSAAPQGSGTSVPGSQS